MYIANRLHVCAHSKLMKPHGISLHILPFQKEPHDLSRLDLDFPSSPLIKDISEATPPNDRQSLPIFKPPRVKGRRSGPTSTLSFLIVINAPDRSTRMH